MLLLAVVDDLVLSHARESGFASLLLLSLSALLALHFLALHLLDGLLRYLLQVLGLHAGEAEGDRDAVSRSQW